MLPLYLKATKKRPVLRVLLNSIILVQLFMPVILIANIFRIPNNRFLMLPVVAVFVVALLTMLFLMRRGYVRQVSIGVVGFPIIGRGAIWISERLASLVR